MLSLENYDLLEVQVALLTLSALVASCSRYSAMLTLGVAGAERRRRERGRDLALDHAVDGTREELLAGARERAEGRAGLVGELLEGRLRRVELEHRVRRLDGRLAERAFDREICISAMCCSNQVSAAAGPGRLVACFN